jgi:hypothetical protein
VTRKGKVIMIRKAINFLKGLCQWLVGMLNGFLPTKTYRV